MAEDVGRQTYLSCPVFLLSEFGYVLLEHQRHLFVVCLDLSEMLHFDTCSENYSINIATETVTILSFNTNHFLSSAREITVTKQRNIFILLQPLLSHTVFNIPKAHQFLKWNVTQGRGKIGTFLHLSLKAMNRFH